MKFDVTGMSCAACSARVEKAVNKVDGVTQCAVSLLTNSMQVEGTASPEAIISAVKAAGYGASLHDKAAAPAQAVPEEKTPADGTKAKSAACSICRSFGASPAQTSTCRPSESARLRAALPLSQPRGPISSWSGSDRTT